MDVIRLLAMVGIVYYHMVFALYQSGIRQLESVRPLFANYNMHVATVGVGLFFMISGAGLMLSTLNDEHLDLKSYYFKRFKKILIPFYLVYVLWLLSFMLLTHQGLDAVYTNNAPAPAFIFTLLGMDAYVASFHIPTFSLGIGEWFLGALVLMYIVFPVLRWGLKKNKWITLGVMTLYYIVILITYRFMPFKEYVPGYVNFTVKVFEFFLGMFIITVIDKIPKYLALGISIPVIIFYLVYPKYLPFNNDLMILTQNLAFFMLFLGLEDVFGRLPKVMKGISFLSGYTYEFFLIHHVVITYMTLQHIGVPFSNKDILVLFVSEFLTVAVLTVVVKGLLGLPGFIKKRAHGAK